MDDIDQQKLLVLNIVVNLYSEIFDQFVDDYNSALQATENLGHNRSIRHLFKHHRERIRDE